MKEGRLVKEERSVVVTGKGKTKEEAIANAFTSFRKQLQGEIGTIVKLEPLEVYILNEDVETEVEKFLWIFMPREKSTYTLEMEIEFQIKYIDLKGEKKC